MKLSQYIRENKKDGICPICKKSYTHTFKLDSRWQLFYHGEEKTQGKWFQTYEKYGCFVQDDN